DSRAAYLRTTNGQLWGRPANEVESGYLLTGLAQCGACGGSLIVHSRGKCGRILPFVALDPWAQSAEGNATHLRQLAEQHGARRVQLHPVVQRFMPNDPRLALSYRTCVELGLVVLAHSGTAKGTTQYAEPRAFADLARAWPDLKVIVAHLGGGSWQQTLDLARAFPHLMFDCCEIIEWTGAPNAPSAEELARLIRDIGSHRVMLGTDFPWYDLDRTAERVMALPILAQEEKEAILGVNAARLLGLDAPSDSRVAR